ncbi:DUF4442 domain-containing protein [Pseudobacter ginsenosidimutans]|uniref:Uncharacterized protein DUF4442 n=1 Tax=Pseudobacter ginsenosidimutans TaxID=661488 RepID=A0A4Q7MY73_9BACT|nr:DUF4442 domain-containing protein [Pseudobacter ginsenosidimutans]QEC42815.1 DUF4442 domain-containing protein [Pseudobacter ginsenosidimutans]RZS74160.1 uncharacterized protein DUF4442 [Pseudobacter ginsenosidimutans]
MPVTPSPEFIRLANHPFKLRLFLLMKLPAAFFSGVRIREMSNRHCKVSVPYRWGTQNPFRSTYFACLAMAAELSTGALAMSLIYKRKQAVSMLIVKMESEYFKKATGRTWFTCEDGEAMQEAVASAINTGTPQTFTALSEGLNEAGEKVAEFKFTWSFRVKS